MKIYMLRGQCSGVDYSKVSASAPSAKALKAHNARENALYGASKDGSPRWSRVHEVEVSELSAADYPLPSAAAVVNEAAVGLPTVSGVGKVE
jgi:hypothetical protein